VALEQKFPDQSGLCFCWLEKKKSAVKTGLSDQYFKTVTN